MNREEKAELIASDMKNIGGWDKTEAENFLINVLAGEVDDNIMSKLSNEVLSLQKSLERENK